ncbi:MAG: bifunctional phosphoribosylaminoimidazolecarboxamide formyltransferase/IMP cyclohydrolase PurH, partial [SAR324 cluster bacterium]|nr:bifunctional phosphoribosylaminoimidazolecarboxamide formyltransferase/IMP cyclohydrolase PurH [SAR324 cluster bacterium]
LHPKVFGGILGRRGMESDVLQLEEYDIPEIDLVVVDLYPFEETVASGADEDSIIEKIDIGGISLIRAAAKNFNDVVIVPSRNEYSFLLNLLNKNNGASTIEDRKTLARRAFNISSHYDTAILNYFSTMQQDPGRNGTSTVFKFPDLVGEKILRYGENPHQKGIFYGDLEAMFEQLHGKELSYNNLLDVDAAVGLMEEFSETTFAILKHNNACGIATRENLIDAWKDALAGDPVSAFGGEIFAMRIGKVGTASPRGRCARVVRPAFPW